MKENPFMYDTHTELIRLLHESGEFDKLRAAREAMSQVFPLTEGTSKFTDVKWNCSWRH